MAQKLGFNPADGRCFEDGKVTLGGRSESLAEAAQAATRPRTPWNTATSTRPTPQSTFGAHFVEVGVDAATGETRVRRMLAGLRRGPHPQPEVGAQPGDRRHDHGRRRGADGGGWSSTHRAGCFINHDMAEYAVPVHADIPHQEVFFLDEVDPSPRR